MRQVQLFRTVSSIVQRLALLAIKTMSLATAMPLVAALAVIEGQLAQQSKEDISPTYLVGLFY